MHMLQPEHLICAGVSVPVCLCVSVSVRVSVPVRLCVSVSLCVSASLRPLRLRVFVSSCLRGCGCACACVRVCPCVPLREQARACTRHAKRTQAVAAAGNARERKKQSPKAISKCRASAEQLLLFGKAAHETERLRCVHCLSSWRLVLDPLMI